MSDSLHGTVARAIVRTVLRSPVLPIVAGLSGPALRRVRPEVLGGATLVEAVDSLLGPMPPLEAEAITREIIVNRLRSDSLKALRGVAGNQGTFGLIRWSDPGVLLEHHARRSPAIFATWHLGPELGTGVALESLGIPATVFRTAPNGNPKRDSKIVDYQCVGDPLERGMALKRAFARLKNGGVVVVAVDGRQNGTSVEVPFFGRRIRVGRGAPALSRLSGAPIMPVVKMWAADGAIDVRWFEPLKRPTVDERDADAFDRALALEAVRWFERFLRSAPGQFRLKNLARLYTAARLERQV